MIKIDSKILLDSFPHPAMIIREDRKILAANDAAKNAGAEIGGYCWEKFGNAANLSDEHYEIYLDNADKQGIQCVFCRADNCLANEAEENDPLLQSDVGIFDTYWVPISRNTYLHYAIDITAIKQSEKEIKDLANRLLLATESAQLGVWDWNVRDNSVLCDERMFKLYGLKRENNANHFDAWFNAIHPEDQESVMAAIEAVLNGQCALDIEFRVLHPDGTVKHVKGNGLVMMGEDGKPERMLGVSADITDRKMTEQEKLKNQQLLEQMGEISNVGGWLFEIDTQLQQWTEETYRIHEVDSDFVPNVENGIDFFVEKSRTKILGAVQRAIKYGEPFDLKLELQTAKGNIRHVHTKGKADLENRRIYGAIQDITEQKALEQAQLRSSQLSALGEVAAGAAHEINNPINGVINYAQLLINKNDENDSSNNILERIIKEGSRISSIVQNLLNFAQKDRGKFSSLNLLDIVVDPLNLSSQFFRKDGIHIDVEIPDDLPEIYGSQMQLEQVILNLLSNARHALNKRFPEPSSEKFIVIDAASLRKQNDEYVQLRVKDFGCGIPKKHLEKIFNPFFTTKEAGVGTGLGMSVSHDILENHGATISVDSQINKFTIMTITFPVNSQ